jgi:hypothetical protein
MTVLTQNWSRDPALVKSPVLPFSAQSNEQGYFTVRALTHVAIYYLSKMLHCKLLHCQFK